MLPEGGGNDSPRSSSEVSWEADDVWANRGFWVEDIDDGDSPAEDMPDEGGGAGVSPPSLVDPSQALHQGDDEEEEDKEEGKEEGSNGIPWIHELHHHLGGENMEGGWKNLRLDTKARGSPFYPFRTITHQILFVFVHKYQISREALEGLVAILQIKHGGKGFDVNDLQGFSAEHFYARTRECLPPLEVKEREVPSTQEGCTSAKVYDTPLNLLLDRECRLFCSTDVSQKYPGGKIVSDEDVQGNCLASNHITSIPVKPKGNIRSSNMHGNLARNSPFFGIDGIYSQRNGRRIFVNDVCVCLMGEEEVLCRALELYWDEEQHKVLVSVRRFHVASEVHNVGDDDTFEGLIRVWEEDGPNSIETLGVAAVLELGEIYSVDEVRRGVHTGAWVEGQRSEWGPFVGEGFVRRGLASSKKRRRAGGAAASPPSFDVSYQPWARGGTADDPLFHIRQAGFYLNKNDLPFFSAPCVWMNDAFNATRMGVKQSIGGGYFGWAWRNNAVQRKRSQTHVGTIAATGACYEGEIGYQCDILGMLQKGCLAKVRVQADNGSIILIKVLFMFFYVTLGRPSQCCGRVTPSQPCAQKFPPPPSPPSSSPVSKRIEAYF